MKKDDLKQLKEKIEADTNKQWYTIKELSKICGNHDESDIAQAITADPDFVRSTQLTTDNQALFTTRRDYNNNSSIATKLLGAFKNRLD